MSLIPTIHDDIPPGLIDRDIGLILWFVNIEVHQRSNNSEGKYSEFIFANEHHAIANSNDDMIIGILGLFVDGDIPLAQGTDPHSFRKWIAQAQGYDWELNIDEEEKGLNCQKRKILSGLG